MDARTLAWKAVAGPNEAAIHHLEMRCEGGAWTRTGNLPDYGILRELPIAECTIRVWQDSHRFFARGFTDETKPFVDRLLAQLSADPQWQPQRGFSGR